MPTRRQVLTATVGGALVAGISFTGDATANATAPPRWRWRGTAGPGRSGDAGRLRVTEASQPITHLSVAWHGWECRVRLRTRAGWGGWRILDGCVGGRDGVAPRYSGGALLVAPGTIGYEVSVTGGGSVQVNELNTASGPAVAAAASTGLPMPDGTVCDVPYLSRAAWGADESLRFVDGVEAFPPEYSRAQALTVHHTAGINNDPDPAATVRAIYFNQAVTQGWGDIGYHLLIDEAGRVYQGRWSGAVDSIPAFRGIGGRTGMAAVTGAHVQGFNTGNVGIVLLGNFTSQLPTAAARESLGRVLTSLARACQLNPLTRIGYVNPVNGATRTVDSICGHRDWAATQCPGNLFYPQLPGLRQEINERLIASWYQVSGSGGGQQDMRAFTSGG